MMRFIRDAKFFTTFCTTRFDYFATVSGRHSLTESVFIYPFSIGWLKSSFHLGKNILLIYNVSSIFWSAKISLFSSPAKQFTN